MPQQFFITGTDTEVGKTFVTCELMQAAKQRGKRVIGMKPLASGAEQTAAGLRNMDALALQAQCSYPIDYKEVNPYAFELAIAPHLAADQAKVSLSLTELEGRCRQFLTREHDLCLIEGVGGWAVPLNQQENMADLVKALEIPVIMVVGMRLGCLNHAQLTYQAILNSGCQLAGWVANSPQPQMPFYQANINTLKHLIKAPLIAEVCFEKKLTLLEQNLLNVL